MLDRRVPAMFWQGSEGSIPTYPRTVAYGPEEGYRAYGLPLNNCSGGDVVERRWPLCDDDSPSPLPLFSSFFFCCYCSYTWLYSFLPTVMDPVLPRSLRERIPLFESPQPSCHRAEVKEAYAGVRVWKKVCEKERERERESV